MVNLMERVLVYGMSNNQGGIESYLLGISTKIKKQGIQFDFLSDFESIAYSDVLKENGSRLFFLPAKGKKLLQHLSSVRKLLIEHPEYKTVYFNVLDAGAVFTVFIPWIMGKKIVIHSHNGATDKIFLHKICRPFLNLMTHERLACSKLAAEYMFGKGQQKRKPAIIIPNAINAERYYFNKKIRTNYRKRMGLEENFVICHVGRISEQKNPFRLIDIFDLLCKNEPKAKLLYVGTGELKGKIYEYVNTKDCAKNISFLGTRLDIAELMQAADVFLLPSLYEGLPIVAIEAQAAGLPIILSTSISNETDLTGNLRFVDLKESDDVWVRNILEYRHFQRKDCRTSIRQAGYDLKYSESEKIVAACLK